MATVQQAIDLLEWHRDERGVAHWEKRNATNGRWSSYGIGLTKLKKLAKQLGGPDAAFAEALRSEPVWECRILAILLEDPKELTVEQATRQVESLDFWMLSYVWCTTLAPRLPYRNELAERWIDEPDDIKRRWGWMIVAEIAKADKFPGDEAFRPLLSRIERELPGGENFVRDAMNNALLAIGMRSAALRTKALAVAKAIGPVVVDYGDNACKAVDVTAHLNSERVIRKLGIG